MIDINRVYQTVLDAHNKENRGFITPSAFNNYSTQAQLEIFESYFSAQRREGLAPMSSGDYDNIYKNIEEKITQFDNSAVVSKGSFTNPAGGVTANYYAYPDNLYRLGVVTANAIIVDEVSHKDVAYINRAPLTAPTVKQPIYTRHEGGIVAYPTALNVLTMVYVRIPALPSWAGASATGQAVPLPTGMRTTTPGATTYYQDFELHPSEEPELIAKILGYAGLETRSPDVIQVSGGKDQQITQQEL